MLTYLGSMTLSAAMPFLLLVEAAYGPILLEFQTKLKAAIKLAATLGIVLPGASLQAAASILAALTLQPPSVSFSVSAVAALIADLNFKIGLLLPLLKFNATAGIHAFAYEGRADGMGTAMVSVPVQTGLPPGSQVYATILLASGGTGATVALKTVFKTA